MSIIEQVKNTANRLAPQFFELSDDVWSYAELGHQEYRSSRRHAEALVHHGFEVRKGDYGFSTAVIGEAGRGGPKVAILGEFDALPSLSQTAGLARPQPSKKGGNGHGCGHNLLGAGSLLASAIVKEFIVETGIAGTIRYYGCPAEELGSTKGLLAKQGAFDDVEVAISWHPLDFTGVAPPVSLACVEAEFRFKGRAAHAGINPHHGRSALDAVELMNVGVNYLREHIPSTARIHYAVVDAGGTAANVVPANAAVRHLIRARSLSEMCNLLERVKKVAKGAALMTETSLSIDIIGADANLVGNQPLEQAMFKALLQVGAPEFDVSDHNFARQMQKTFEQRGIVSAFEAMGLTPDPNQALSGSVDVLTAADPALFGSTDVGTVSWLVPTVQCHTTCFAVGTPFHSWQLVAQGKSAGAHKGLQTAAEAMAVVAIRTLLDQEFRQEVRSFAAKSRSEPSFKHSAAEWAILLDKLSSKWQRQKSFWSVKAG